MHSDILTVQNHINPRITQYMTTGLVLYSFRAFILKKLSNSMLSLRLSTPSLQLLHFLINLVFSLSFEVKLVISKVDSKPDKSKTTKNVNYSSIPCYVVRMYEYLWLLVQFSPAKPNSKWINGILITSTKLIWSGK